MLRFCFICIVSVFLCLSTEAQTLVKDINSDTADAFELDQEPEFVFFNSMVCFVADDGIHGKELWKTTGTDASTVMVKNINTKPAQGSDPYDLVVMSTNVYFFADDGNNGVALWKSSGTDAGTVLVKSFPYDDRQDSKNRSSSLDSLALVGTTLYFSCSLPTHKGLWKSTGTASGTTLVKKDLSIMGIEPAENIIYMVAKDESTRATDAGYELWMSDGTEAGTYLVKDVNPGSTTSSIEFHKGAVIGNSLYFTADDGTHGRELWRCDGSGSQTYMVKDINSGSESSNPGGLSVMDGILYFTANDEIHGVELWRSDGTESGTWMVKDILDGDSSSPSCLTVVGKTLYFTADDVTNGRELWRTNGAADNTIMVKDIYSGTSSSTPKYMAAVGNETVYFGAEEGTNGRELWKSNGTSIGTTLVKDLWSGTNGSDPQFLFNANGVLYFVADDGSTMSRSGLKGRELYKSQGLTSNTVLVADINEGSTHAFDNDMYHNGNSTVSGTTLFFMANDGSTGYELWKSNGTAAGTVLVKDITPGSGSTDSISFPGDKTTSSTVFFTVKQGATEHILWKSDGTTNGTVQLKDGEDDILVDNTFVSGNYLYFQKINDSDRLWVTDGITFKRLVNKDTGNYLVDTADGIIINNVVYFIATEEGTSELNLWKIATVPEQAVKIVKSDDQPIINVATNNGFTSLGTTIIFLAKDIDSVYLLWKIGTNGKAVKISETCQPEESSFGSTTNFVYFTVLNNGFHELWKTNGTTVEQMKDSNGNAIPICARPDSGGPDNPNNFMMGIGSILYFQTDLDYSAWYTDGTSAGTKLLRDSDGRLFSQIFDMEPKSAGSTFYFSFDDGVHGTELWQAGGTPITVKRVSDLNPNGSAWFDLLREINGVLYFVADNGLYGRELWKK